MNISAKCGNCAHMREHEQLGGMGAWCHGMPPSLSLMPTGGQIVRGRATPTGMNQVGLYAPVDKEGGWCRLHELSLRASSEGPGEVVQ